MDSAQIPSPDSPAFYDDPNNTTFAPVSGLKSRRVLILDFDLFWSRTIGGGQTTYKQIIRHNPDNQYFYLTIKEAADAARPANATAIPFREFYQEDRRDLPAQLDHFYLEYLNSWNVARSISEAVGPLHFDIADIPDYSDTSLFLRGALAHHGITVEAVAISLHGKLEVVINDQWPVPGKYSRDAAAARIRTHLQFRAADIRYGLSTSYARHRETQTGLSANLIDPLTITGPIAPEKASHSDGPPTVAFIGRLERCKGPDVFVDLAWCLREGTVRSIAVVGSENVSPAGVSSDDILKAMAARRRLAVELVGNRPQGELQTLFRERTIVVVSSRYDTFNLAALEALRLGCPVFISRQAGISEWIKEKYPELLHLVLDFECSRAAADSIRNAVANYDAVREGIVNALGRKPYEPDFELLKHTYDGPQKFDSKARQTIADLQSRFDSFNRPIPRASTDNPGGSERQSSPPADVLAAPAAETFRRKTGTRKLLHVINHYWIIGRTAVGTIAKSRGMASSDLTERLRVSGLFDEAFYLATYPDVAESGIDPIRHYLDVGASQLRDPNPLFNTSWYLSGNPDVARAGVNPLVHYMDHGVNEGRDPHPDSRWQRQASDLDRVREILLRQDERTQSEIAGKLHDVGSTLSNVKVGRAAIFREMARLARKSGSDLHAAIYCIRLMRWLGRDRYGDLAFVVDTLNRYDHSAEAEVATAMFGNPVEADRRCRVILDRVEGAHRAKPDLPWAILDDRRSDAEPKVSVIVSLYNAEARLPTLLANLAMQSLANRRGMEIVLIDSNSPTGEYRVFQDFAATHDIPVVYARSEKRETIPAAWNRGIKLARAPYLALLGADEGLHPDGLEILSHSLDSQPEIDWAMADSITTEVDRHGRYVQDGMAFDRTGYSHEIAKLDATYLSFVGGLYRKSIHTRFGFYDESFKAAGGTEFKYRILRHIKVLHIPKVLGVYNNFPDERVTNGPVAEVEDLRARYLHGTKAAIAHDYDEKPIEIVKDLFRLSLGYRKANQKGTCTDFDMAAAVADHLCERPDTDIAFAEQAAKTAHRMLGLIREIELLDYCAPAEQRGQAMERILRFGKAMQPHDALNLGLDEKPVYDFFNDTRFDLHSWSWT